MKRDLELPCALSTYDQYVHGVRELYGKTLEKDTRVESS